MNSDFVKMLQTNNLNVPLNIEINKLRNTSPSSLSNLLDKFLIYAMLEYDTNNFLLCVNSRHLEDFKCITCEFCFSNGKKGFNII